MLISTTLVLLATFLGSRLKIDEGSRKPVTAPLLATAKGVAQSSVKFNPFRISFQDLSVQCRISAYWNDYMVNVVHMDRDNDQIPVRVIQTSIQN